MFRLPQHLIYTNECPKHFPHEGKPGRQSETSVERLERSVFSFKSTRTPTVISLVKNTMVGLMSQSTD